MSIILGAVVFALVCLGWYLAGVVALWALGRVSGRAETAVRSAFREAWRAQWARGKRVVIRIRRPLL